MKNLFRVITLFSKDFKDHYDFPPIVPKVTEIVQNPFLIVKRFAEFNKCRLERDDLCNEELFLSATLAEALEVLEWEELGAVGLQIQKYEVDEILLINLITDNGYLQAKANHYYVWDNNFKQMIKIYEESR